MTIRLSTAIDRRQRIRRAVRYIEATLQSRSDARLPVAELAQVACMSPYHFIRRYTHAVGDSPDASVRRLRLQLARRMLATDAQASITQVALKFGYDNAASFSRAYRRMFGSAPSTDTQGEHVGIRVETSLVQCPPVRLQSLPIERGDSGVWSAFDELLGHLDVSAVPRPAQDMYAVVSPDGGFQRAAVLENAPVRCALRLPRYDAQGGLHVRIKGQPQAVWAALRDDERLFHTRRYDEPLLLRYLNDPAYRALPEQRVSLLVPLVKGTRFAAK